MATYLELVNKAIRKSGAKVEAPTTIVGASGLTFLFVEWVQDAWKDIQIQHLGWLWRVARDQTITLVDGTDEYSLPSTLEHFDNRTVSVYENVDDEYPMEFVNYHYWRVHLNKANPATEAKPQKFTLTPDKKIAVYPTPDKEYTLRYDGHLAVQMLDMADDSDTPDGLSTPYHDGIMWKAVEYYAAHFEDGAKLQEAVDMFKPYKKYYEERQLEDVTIDTTAMYRWGYSYGN